MSLFEVTIPILEIVHQYSVPLRTKLVEWIPKEVLEVVPIHTLDDLDQPVCHFWKNPRAIEWVEQLADAFMESCLDTGLMGYLRFYASGLSANPHAIGILEKYPSLIDTLHIPRNPNAFHLSQQLPPNNYIFLNGNPNPCVIEWLEQNPTYIRWSILSSNPAAIHLLKQNPENIVWSELSANPNAVPMLEKHLDKVDWSMLSLNPQAIHLLEQHPDKINWGSLCHNPNAYRLLKEFIGQLDENPNSMFYLDHLMRYNTNPAILELTRPIILRKIEENENTTWDSMLMMLGSNPAIFEDDVERNRISLREWIQLFV